MKALFAISAIIEHRQGWLYALKDVLTVLFRDLPIPGECLEHYGWEANDSNE